VLARPGQAASLGALDRKASFSPFAMGLIFIPLSIFQD
jgi:hypothetical protein